ncbi:MAG: efflux RND transporter permease subunit [Candidatus Omnitrophica bacterium]|nr:efflux RND transporter permease subunit [Candidatus Omnitrophota bacterium]
MTLSEFSVHHKTTVAVLIVIIIITGSYAYLTLPRESFPDITIPYIIVTTQYEGVAPSDIENLITNEIEKKLITISEIDELRSYSSEGASTIVVEFTTGIDTDAALQKVRDKVDEAKSELPSDLDDDPIVDEINLAEFPIMTVVVSGPVGLVKLKDIADDMSDDFESVSGVLEAPVLGGLEREIRVVYEPERLAAYKLSVTDVMNSVLSNNLNTPGGKMDIGPNNYLVKIPGEFEDPSEARKIIVFSNDKQSIYITDVARMVDGFEEPKTKSRNNQKESVSINIVKRSGENIIEISEEIKKIVADYQATSPEGVDISIVMDQSKDIYTMISDLENSVLSGLILVLIVVLFAMGLRNAMIVASAIPLSMLITFFVLKYIGLTLNMIVLFSLVLAVGMLVDNAIVIVENIYRHRTEGKGRLEASVTGSREVMWPVIASTATTVGAFFPIVFWPGIMGEFMGYLPQTVIIALIASLFVALIVNPTLCALFMRVKPKHAEKKADGFFMRAYTPVIAAAVRNPFYTLSWAVSLLILVVYAYSQLGHGIELFPEIDPKRAYVNINMPTGANIYETDALVKQLEAIAAEYPEIQNMITTVGSSGSSNILSPSQSDSPDAAQIMLEFPDMEDRTRPSEEVLQELRRRFHPFYQAEIEIQKEENDPSSGAPVTVELSGESYNVLVPLMREIKERIRGIPGLVNMDDDYVVARPEIIVKVDKERAALMKLNTREIATNIKAAIRGIDAGVYREGNDEYDIVVQLPLDRRKDLYALRNLMVSGLAGNHVPLSSVAGIELSAGLGTIVRTDQKRVITIEAEAEGRLGNDVLKDVQKELAGLNLPQGYQLQYRGEDEDRQEAQEFLSEAFVAALMIITLILVTEFNSIYKPFVILSSVILSTIGVFIGLLITYTPFGVIMTGVGVISLAGVVVNNAIVLLDYTDQLRERGRSHVESLIEAGRVRLRPVVLTAVTTILGLIPMAVGVSYDFRSGGWQIGSESAQWWSPMAVAVIFGLAVATLLTLIVVPAMVSAGDMTIAACRRLNSAARARQTNPQTNA